MKCLEIIYTVVVRIIGTLDKYDQIKSNHFYCHITTAQVPWWVKFLSKKAVKINLQC